MQKRFVVDASHELRTPLTVVAANTELLQERCAGISAEADRWMERANRERREMRSLVRSLLPLAKSDSRVPEKGESTRFSLNDLAMGKILIFRPVFYQKEKALEYKIEGDVIIMGNPSRVGQLIKALMDNVVKYSVPRGRAEVRLKPAGRNRARSRVCSRGEPIPEDKHMLIFRRFCKNDGARSNTNGYGLGLAIAAETAKSHRVRIEAEYRGGMSCSYVTVKRGRVQKRVVLKGRTAFSF